MGKLLPRQPIFAVVCYGDSHKLHSLTEPSVRMDSHSSVGNALDLEPIVPCPVSLESWCERRELSATLYIVANLLDSLAKSLDLNLTVLFSSCPILKLKIGDDPPDWILLRASVLHNVSVAVARSQRYFSQAERARRQAREKGCALHISAFAPNGVPGLNILKVLQLS